MTGMVADGCAERAIRRVLPIGESRKIGTNHRHESSARIIGTNQWIVTEMLLDAVPEQGLRTVSVQAPGASRPPSVALIWPVA